MKECKHVYGIWDNDSSVIGRCLFITNPNSRLYNDPDCEKFKFCPECGKQLIKD